MQVEVFNKYWECINFYWNIERVEDKEREFILHIKGGSQKYLAKQIINIE